MPRPHSPDCLLWAKNLKDEHTRLKVRTTALEQTVSKYQDEISATETTRATFQEMVKDLTALTGRVSHIETDDQKSDSMSGRLIVALREQVLQLGKKLNTQANKINSLERTSSELYEDRERADRDDGDLYRRLQHIEEVVANLPRVSPRVPKKNDTSSTTALTQLVESMRSMQETDHQTMERLYGQVQRLITLTTVHPRMLSNRMPVRTPTVHEASSPVVQVAGSPLVEKQARTSAGRTTAPPATRSGRTTAHKAYVQAKTAAGILASKTNEHHVETTVSAAMAPEAETSPVEEQALAANSGKKRKAAPGLPPRQTRSKTRLSGGITQSAKQVEKAVVVEQSAVKADAKAELAAVQPKPVRTKAPNARTAIPYFSRRRRVIQAQPDLPPLEELSD